MPSRIIHDVIRHLLETSEVHFHEDPLHDYTISGFGRVYLGQFPQQIKVRRYVRYTETMDLPVEIYTEFIQYLHHLLTTGQTFNVGRRFTNVRVTYMELSPNLEMHGNDIKLEFMVDSIDTDHWEREAIASQERFMRAGTRRSAMLPPDYMEVNKCKIKMPPKKHFEDDLFEV